MKFSSIQIRLINIIVINKCETFTNTPSIKLFINYFNIINVEDKRRGGGGEGRSIYRWPGNEDFKYGISRFWEFYVRETVFPTLDGASNYLKK